MNTLSNFLQELSAPNAMCLRDDAWADIRVSELVVGDLIQVKGGDVIPADAKVQLMKTVLYSIHATDCLSTGWGMASGAKFA